MLSGMKDQNSGMVMDMSDSRSIIRYQDTAVPALRKGPRSAIPVPPIVDGAGQRRPVRLA